MPRRDDGRQPREGKSRKPRRKASEKSDALVVPEKSTNLRVTPKESTEGRSAANGKLAERDTRRIQGRESVPTYLARVGHKAKQNKEEKLTNLMCHIKVPLLKEAYQRLRKNAAPGVDAVTWAEYGALLEERLVDLQDRVHRGSYHPQPVRRVHIPKGDGRTRPLGIPAVEDKIVQQAVRMVLEPIYESVFLGFSYGFRPGRSPHRALDALAVAISKKVNWILDADIRAFFDSVDHAWMQRFIEHRIGDRRLVRLLMKWLKAGVMEEGQLYEVEAGTPQGGIISPLLANIYLHYVFDLWAHAWRKKHARGDVYLVRYADDFVVGFKYDQDARNMRKALQERLARFGLELHPEKTRTLSFGRYAWDRAERLGRRKPEVFDFLGFTHICARTKSGFRLLRQTSRKKRQAKLRAIREELRRRRHAALSETHVWLSSVLRGHYNYYGVPGNLRGPRTFRAHVQHAWYRQLSRRGQRRRYLSTRAKQRMEDRFPLPKPRTVHPWPEQRFRGP